MGPAQRCSITGRISRMLVAYAQQVIDLAPVQLHSSRGLSEYRARTVSLSTQPRKHSMLYEHTSHCCSVPRWFPGGYLPIKNAPEMPCDWEHRPADTRSAAARASHGVNPFYESIPETSCNTTDHSNGWHWRSFAIGSQSSMQARSLCESTHRQADPMGI